MRRQQHVEKRPWGDVIFTGLFVCAARLTSNTPCDLWPQPTTTTVRIHPGRFCWFLREVVSAAGINAFGKFYFFCQARSSNRLVRRQREFAYNEILAQRPHGMRLLYKPFSPSARPSTLLRETIPTKGPLCCCRRSPTSESLYI